MRVFVLLIVFFVAVFIILVAKTTLTISRGIDGAKTIKAAVKDYRKTSPPADTIRAIHNHRNPETTTSNISTISNIIGNVENVGNNGNDRNVIKTVRNIIQTYDPLDYTADDWLANQMQEVEFARFGRDILPGINNVIPGINNVIPGIDVAIPMGGGVMGDRQNVHDSAVIASTRNINDELKQTIGESHQNLDHVKTGIQLYDGLSADIKEAAISSLKHITQNVYSALGEREYDIFMRVWNKARQDDNVLHNLIMNLSECKEGGSPVCLTGRVTRYLAAIDPTKVLNKEASYKDEIMSKARIAMREAVEKCVKNPGCKWRRAAQDWEGLGDLPEDELELAKAEIAGDFDAILEQYVDKIDIQKIRTELISILDAM
jgi:hypothetical protein